MKLRQNAHISIHNVPEIWCRSLIFPKGFIALAEMWPAGGATGTGENGFLKVGARVHPKRPHFVQRFLQHFVSI